MDRSGRRYLAEEQGHVSFPSDILTGLRGHTPAYRKLSYRPNSELGSNVWLFHGRSAGRDSRGEKCTYDGTHISEQLVPNVLCILCRKICYGITVLSYYIPIVRFWLQRLQTGKVDSKLRQYAGVFTWLMFIAFTFIAFFVELLSIDIDFAAKAKRRVRQAASRRRRRSARTAVADMKLCLKIMKWHQAAAAVAAADMTVAYMNLYVEFLKPSALILAEVRPLRHRSQSFHPSNLSHDSNVNAKMEMVTQYLLVYDTRGSW